jgi:hypothetical protein
MYHEVVNHHNVYNFHKQICQMHLFVGSCKSPSNLQFLQFVNS